MVSSQTTSNSVIGVFLCIMYSLPYQNITQTAFICAYNFNGFWIDIAESQPWFAIFEHLVQLNQLNQFHIWGTETEMGKLFTLIQT